MMVIGAGVTRGAYKDRVPPPPLDSDFFDVAGQLSGRGTGRLAARVRKDVFELYGQVSGVGLEEYYRDIEARGEIGRFAKSKNRPKDWKKRQSDLEELIRRVLICTTCDMEDGSAKVGPSTDHTSLLRHVLDGDTLVTFNYETVIEESLPSSTAWDPGDGYGVDTSGKTLSWAKGWRARKKRESKVVSQIRLLKLHGSVNWTLDENNRIRLKPRPYVVRARKGVAVFDKCAILPPGWHKRIDINPYRQLWREARLQCEKCSSLAIIGYSLPDTDLLAKALFAEVSRSRAAKKKFLEHFYVADPSEVVRNRLVNLFVPALGPKGRVYRYEGIEDLGRAWRTDGPRR
ncbi:MAG: hypothetical protein WAW79_13275 [Steroidobacteraceae bacterium]